MTEAFAKKYDAGCFNPDDPNEALADRARRAVLVAYEAAMVPADDDAPRQLEYLLAGLLVGVVQVMQSSLDAEPDHADASIRASIIQTAPWAVDVSRAMQGHDPLPDRS